MTLRPLSFVGVVATTALALAAQAVPAAQHIGGPRVSFGESHFPSRSLIIRAPADKRLSTSSVHVTENGTSVEVASVASILRANVGDFGVVLAIDTSPSMRGAPLASAMAAARALAAQRRGNQELGVVTFDESPTVALPLTSDPRAIAHALAHVPSVGRGAHIYDALSAALHQLQTAGIADGAVILLSDGDSQGAKPHAGAQVTLHSIVANATENRVRIFTVGLRDSAFTPERMKLLARVGGGAFFEASSAQLDGVFSSIESALTSEYLVRYRSTQSPGHHVTVAVSVDGIAGRWMSGYSSPATTPGTMLHKTARTSRGTLFWATTLALVLVAFGSALLLTIAFTMLLMPSLRRQDLRSRVSEFTSTDSIVEPVDAIEKDESLGPVYRIIHGMAWWPVFKENLDIARIARSPESVLLLTITGSATCALLFAALTGTPWIAVIVLLLGPVIMQAIIRQRMTRQQRRFIEQLPSHIQEMAAAMRAGHSLVGALRSMAESASEPARTEFMRVLADEQLGIPLDAALLPVARRMACDDVRQVALVASLHQQTGGNMAVVLDQVAGSVRERSELRRELESLTAQARLSRWIVTLLPVGLLLIITVLNKDYERPLFDTVTGEVLLSLGIMMIIAGSLIMRKIVDVKV